MVQFASVEELVAALGGRRPITKLLVASNGLAAVKCIRSVRKWALDAFGNERQVSERR